MLFLTDCKFSYWPSFSDEFEQSVYELHFTNVSPNCFCGFISVIVVTKTKFLQMSVIKVIRYCDVMNLKPILTDLNMDVKVIRNVCVRLAQNGCVKLITSLVRKYELMRYRTSYRKRPQVYIQAGFELTNF